MHKHFYAAFSPLLYYYQFSCFLKTYNGLQVFLYFQPLSNMEFVWPLSFPLPAPVMGSFFLCRPLIKQAGVFHVGLCCLSVTWE